MSNFFVIEEIKKEESKKETNVNIDHTSKDYFGENLAICPMCHKRSLKIEGGCHSCLNEECGYSKCDV